MNGLVERVGRLGVFGGGKESGCLMMAGLNQDLVVKWGYDGVGWR